MGEDLEKLRQEYEDAKVKAAQYRNQVTRLQNRLSYKENRTRKERAHAISGEMAYALCEAPPKLAFRLLRRCRSVQGANAPCAACAAIPFSNGRFPGTVGNSPPAGKTEYRFLHKTVCRVSR